MIGEILCKLGFHKWVYYQHPVRHNGRVSEHVKICIRKNCERMIIQ